MDPSPADDAIWWQRARDGDGDAFGLLFDRHSERVFRHASRLVEVRHEAEDVTAAAFLELWRRRAHVRFVAGSVLPWLSSGSARHHLVGSEGTAAPHPSSAPSLASRLAGER